MSTAQTAAPESASTNKLAEDVIIEGKLSFTERLVFDGRIKGEVESSDGSLAVQPKAIVEAKVTVKSLLVEGKVVGDIIATESVRLAPTAVVIGDITTGNLTVEPNANFKGQATIGKPTQAAQSNSAKATQAAASPAPTGNAPINGKINGKMPAPASNSTAAKTEKVS